MDEKKRAVCLRLLYEIPCACWLGFIAGRVYAKEYRGDRHMLLHRDIVIERNEAVGYCLILIVLSAIVFLPLIRARAMEIATYIAFLFLCLIAFIVLFPIY